MTSGGLRFLTAGESHGRCLTAVLEGMVAGLRVNSSLIDRDLQRRQWGYGRGGRMSIEKDTAEILSGIRCGVTTGSPLALKIPNRDFKIDVLPKITKPRPGHADLAGALKYDRRDVRDVLERASARETAARVAIGSVCRQFLECFGVDILSHVIELGGIRTPKSSRSFEKTRFLAEKSAVRCADLQTTSRMIEKIDSVKRDKNTLGGLFEIQIKGVRAGVGSSRWGEWLDSRLTFGLMSIQAVKGVEVCRGIAGDTSNGEMIVLRAVMKPIATLMSPLGTVDIDTKKPEKAAVERSDVTAVPACGVVGEAMAAFELADCFLRRFGGGALKEVLRRYKCDLRHRRG